MNTSEKAYLQDYNIHDYDLPLVSVDVAIFTLHKDTLQILLVRRGDHPHKGRWSLPGGFIDLTRDTDLYATASRKLKEKTGVDTPYLEQVASVGNRQRDPRGWSVTVLFMALIPHVQTLASESGVMDAKWHSYDTCTSKKLAFDHAKLLQQARERLKNKSAYTALPIYLLEPPFTLTQLQHAFEELLGKSIEKKSFRRRMQAADLLEEAGESLPEGGRGRIASLYRPKTACEDYSFLRAFGSSTEEE